MAIVASLESQSKALANLSLHSQRLSAIRKTVIQLRDFKMSATNRKNTTCTTFWTSWNV